jgi:hypothetical protein
MSSFYGVGQGLLTLFTQFSGWLRNWNSSAEILVVEIQFHHQRKVVEIPEMGLDDNSTTNEEFCSGAL